MRINEGGAAQRIQSEQPKPTAARTANSAPNADTGVNFQSKKHELEFAGAFRAAKLRGEPNQPTPTAPTPPPGQFQTDGSGTETSYRVGSPTRPNIRHDNGFRQNPNDPNDPNLTPVVPPSFADRRFYAGELVQADGAQGLEKIRIPFTDFDDNARPRRLEDGIDAYRHYLTGNGADRTFSYDEFVSEDANGQATLNNAIADTQRGAEQLYNQMVERDPSLAGKSVTFDVTSGAISVREGSTEYPYPETENWQKAIGAHSIWNSATVTVTPPSAAGGAPQFSMDYTLHAEDRYNFNPDAADIATGEPDAVRGLKLERTGLAHQYMNYATLDRDVSWTAGDINGTTQVSNNSDDGNR